MRSNSWKVWLTALTPAIFIGLAGASRPALAEYSFEVMKSFELPDGGPSLVIGADGVLYGTTARGGVVNQGSFFRIDADGSFSVPYKFDGTEGDGRSGLVLGSDGAFYGTTVGGGSSGWGTIFRLDGAGVLTTLHSFDGSDGAHPSTGYPWSTTSLVLGSDGALYGTTALGGSFGRGTVFRIDPGGSFRSLHSFQRWNDVQPRLTLGSDGALYGVTRASGQAFPGTVFRIDGAGTFTTVYSFVGEELEDGFRLNVTLTLGSDGALYGTMFSSAALDGGRVFRVDGAGNLTTVHSFDSAFDRFGSYPTAPLVLGSDGALYGTTVAGGFGNAGTAFRIDSEGTFTFLHSFAGRVGGISAHPAFLAVGTDGAVYGTELGSGFGFKVDSAGRFTTVQAFGGPTALVVGSNGALYGSQEKRIFRIDDADTSTTLYSFPPSADGFYPQPVLALGGDGAIYGATRSGGASNGGALFKLDRTGTFSSLHAFGEGGDAISALVRGDDGAVYGVTQPGLFEIDGTGTFTSLHSNALGVFPGGDGTLYGFDNATAFGIDSAGNVTTLIDFSSDPGDPVYGSYSSVTALALASDGRLYGNRTRVRYGELGTPYTSNFFFRSDGAGAFTDLLGDWHGASALVRGSDGAFYGTTLAPETIFRIDGAGTLTTVHSFTGTDRLWPNPALVLGNDGALYGTTSAGGAAGFGTVFKLDGAGTFTSLHSFDDAEGWGPRRGLLLASDGSLYGTTERGGASGVGTVFRIDHTGTFTLLHSYSTGYDFADGALIVANDCSLYGTAAGYSPPGIVYRLFEARPPCQHIDFDLPVDQFFGEPPFTVSATASSGLPVSLRASGPCTVSGDRITLTGVGRCTLTASQGGNADYEPAPEVTRTFDVRSAACSDGLDNDADGSTDFGSDPDCSSAIDTNENGAPVATCRNVTVAAAAGACGASASVDGGSSDADGHSLDLAQSPAGPYALGTTPVTLRVTDSFGGASACQALVTVTEETPPEIDCGPSALPRGKGAVLRLSWSATDTCSLATATTSAPQCFVAKKNGRRVGQPCTLLVSGDLSFRKRPKKNTHVAWTVTARDAAGNESTKQCESVIGKRRP